MKKENNLLAGKNKGWEHTPTRAIRVPQIFVNEIVEFARSLDNGEPLQSQDFDLESLPLEQLLEIEKNLPSVIEEKTADLCDRTLEDAIFHLSSACDGAQERDGLGFNRFDAPFGHWLSEQTNLTQQTASKAYRMLCKYREQLEKVGLDLPPWETIKQQYPKRRLVDDEIDNRVELHGEEIRVYFKYDPDEVAAVKSIEPRGKYNSTDKSWRFKIEAAEELLELCGDRYDIDPDIEGLLIAQLREKEIEQQQKIDQAQRAAEESIQLIRSAKLDQPLPCGWSLFEHQQKAVEWLLTHRQGGIYYRGGILADHMGLGKTLSALTAAKILSQYHQDCPVFVVCPASLRANWGREAEKVRVTIETFSWSKQPNPLKSPYILIADEAHYAQNPGSARTKKLLTLAENENCKAVWLLSGTPIKNGRPINLFPLLKAVAHPLSRDKSEYEKYYCAAGYKDVGRRTVWDNSGASHLDELAITTEDVILRRTKSDCLDLPEKQRIMKSIELETSEKKAYDKEIDDLVEDYRDRALRGEVDVGAKALVTLNILRKVGSRYKVEEAITLAEELLEQGQQVVIFTEYLESANLLYTRLSDICKTEILTGKTKQEERQGIVDRFQSGESKVFVGTIKAGGVGLTLTAANNVILVDRPWTPGEAEQAEDRCHRIGQDSSVSAYWLQLGMIDEIIDQLLESKQKRIELTLKGKRKTLRGLDSPKELAKQLLNSL